MRPKISAVINTLNEEKNLPYTLMSIVKWVDEIIVVDMYSDDQTVEIAKRFGAHVFFHERVGYVEPAREYAMSKATGEWVLVIDADEVVPSPLSEKLCEIKDQDLADVVIIPWLSYLLGKPMMYTGWGPNQSKHPRFFKAGFVKSAATIHKRLQFSQDARTLELDYEPGYAVVHFNYVDTTHFLDKLNRYTTIEAQQASRNGKKASTFRAIMSALREFHRRYLILKGYKDGWQGFYLSAFSGFYRLITYAKLKELEVYGSGDIIEDHYHQEAEKILDEYQQQDVSQNA